ncbi:MAG: MerR family transcriptional regulator [Anaerolineae bacterium]|nr:MerR family transcriptional regulator [Anaerolineae bacterium]
MKMKQVAERLGKHENTIRNYARQFAEFLSPEPQQGEHRVFTDDDMRILGFISRLSESGLKQNAIRDALKQKLTEGTPFPPILPTPPQSEPRGLITLQEMEVRLAAKDAELRELQGRIEELRRENAALREQQQREREAYLKQIMELSSKLSEEIGRLKAELKVRSDG